MKPIKSLYPFAVWMLRLAIIVTVLPLFYKGVLSFEYKQIGFYIALCFCIAAIVVFFGGFSNKSTLTIIGAFLLFGLCIYEMIAVKRFELSISFGLYLLLASVAMLFISSGNKK